MTTVIKLKRGTTTPTTSDIVSGEVAVDTSNQKLYINDGGSIKEIGGAGASSFKVADNSSTETTISSGDTLKVAAGTGINTTISGDTLTITATGSASVNWGDVDADILPDTNNAYDVGQVGSSFRDVTFTRKVQKNVEVFTTALGLGTTAANFGFNIQTSVANFTEVYTNSGGLGSPVLGGANSTFDDSNPAFLF